jgi:glutamyl/glutaminyl-tRNA synthetase
LLAWWHARSRGGRIVLRLEDFDAERVKPGMIEATLEDLCWLGLGWDGEPYVQSSGGVDIDTAAESLLARGLAYPGTCTRKERLPSPRRTPVRRPRSIRGPVAASMRPSRTPNGPLLVLRPCASSSRM